MFPNVDDVLISIKQIEKRIEQKAFELRKENKGINSDALIASVSSIPFSGSIAAVDAGLIGREVQGHDILFLKTVGVLFNYDSSKLLSHSYRPSIVPRVASYVQSSLAEHEILISRNLMRLREEVTCAFEIVNAYHPDILFIDGSLAPLPSDRPDKTSILFPLYSEVLEKYKQLFSSSSTVIGVSKDSRSKRFCSHYGIPLANDITLMSYLLGENERTCVVNYSSTKTEIMQDLGCEIYAFYIRPVSSDLPLRIECLSPDVDKIAGIVNSLSKISTNYAYPAALIEADLRACFTQHEIDQVARLPLTPLRRNNRPFR